MFLIFLIKVRFFTFSG